MGTIASGYPESRRVPFTLDDPAMLDKGNSFSAEDSQMMERSRNRSLQRGLSVLGLGRAGAPNSSNKEKRGESNPDVKEASGPNTELVSSGERPLSRAHSMGGGSLVAQHTTVIDGEWMYNLDALNKEYAKRRKSTGDRRPKV